ncbi:MAG TPA: FtsX-like permease family protein [Candidatus Limnocylindrales bacterium]|nr:FtsX-like permease family protein [Candidatus Limnocylindrales bacterium]
MVRSFGLLRAVLQRGRADASVVTAAWLLLVCATTLLAATTLYADTVAVGGLRQAVAAASPASRSVDVRLTVAPDEVAARDAIVRPIVASSLEAVGGPVVRVARTDPFSNADEDPATATDLVGIGSYEGIADHAALVQGRWATAGSDPIEATLSAPAASALGLTVGDHVALVDIHATSVRVDLVVVGLWRPNDPDDGYWLGGRLELDGSEPGAGFVTRGPFVVADGDLLARPMTRDVAVEWRGLVPIGALTPDSADRLRRDVTVLRPRLAPALPPLSQLAVATDLPTLLDATGRSIAVSASSIALLTLQFAVLAAYAVLLVAGMLVERRRAEVAVLRSRGASTIHLVAMTVLEALLLTVPAVALAPFLGLAVVRAVAALGPSGAAPILADARLGLLPAAAAIAAGIGCIVALSLPTIASGLDAGGIRAALGRPVARTLAQRAGLDLALVVLAAIALWQLRLYGAPLTRNGRGVLGADPLLVAAPAIGLVAGGVLAVRVLPRVAEVAERILDRARGLVIPLGARQLARRPLRYTRSALLLMLAVALGTFAAAYAATWNRSQSDQASYETAADVRVVANDYPQVPAWASGSIVRSTPGVAAAMPVSRQAFDLARTVRGGQLLALDAGTAASIATIDPRPGSDASAVLATLAAARPTTGVPLPGSPRRLAVTLDASLRYGETAPDPSQEPKAWQGLDLAVVVADATGRLSRIPVGSATFDGQGQRLVVPLVVDLDGLTGVPSPPLRLEAVEVTVDPPPGVGTTGRLDLRGVDVSDEPSGTSAGTGWRPVPLVPNAPGWGWLEVSAGTTHGYSPPSGSPARIEIGGGEAGALVISNDEPAPVYRLWDGSAAGRPVAAVASSTLLDVAGARVGDTLTADAGVSPISLRIVGSTDLFAPLDPAVPFVVVDGPTLDLDRFAAVGDPATINEWWLAIHTGAASAVEHALSVPPFGARQVVVRDDVAERLSTDPVSLGAIGALALGALAALAFATIGFLVNAAVSTAERTGELALLRALGLSGRQLVGWLAVESAVLLAVGMVGGAALGLLLAWLVLPFATLTATGLPPVPSPVIVVPVETLLPAYLLAVVLLVVAIVVLVRQLPSVHVGGVLRARDEA